MEAGISKVEVSATARCAGITANDVMELSIYKNNTQVGPAAATPVCAAGGAINLVQFLTSVQEEDVLYLYICNYTEARGSTNTSVPGQTRLTVRVVE